MNLTGEMQKNPYIAGRPVEAQEMFFGREDIFDFVKKNLIGRFQDNAIVLFGELRTGKTSVLKQMSHHLGGSHVCVFIDLAGITITGMKGFLWRVAYEVWKALQAEGIEISEPQLADYTGADDAGQYFSSVFLERVKQAIGDRHLLMMFDETLQLLDAVKSGKLEKGIYPYLRYLIQNQVCFDTIFCITKKPYDLDMEFTLAFRNAINKEISFLDRDSVTALITRPVTGLYEYSATAVNEIYRLTYGHPLYVQLICHQLFDRWQTQRRERIDARDVHSVLDDVVEKGRSHFSLAWEALPDVEKVVLAALANVCEDKPTAYRQDIELLLKDCEISLAPGDITTALQYLFEARIINSTEPYWVHVDLLRRWVHEHKKIEWVKEDYIRRQGAGAEKDMGLEETRRQYLDYVREGCQWMALPELTSLPLMDLYVPLQVAVARSEELPKYLASRARALYLAELKAGEAELDLALERELADEMRHLGETVERRREDAIQLLRENRPLVILGDPGAGKTTFLKHLALKLSEEQSIFKESQAGTIGWLPILVPVGAYAAARRSDRSLTLADYLPRHFASKEIPLADLSALFQEELNGGRCLILLDGLDTVMESVERHEVVHCVDEFVGSYLPYGNHFVITSGIDSYRETPLEGNYLHCTACELEIDEIEAFARKWWTAYATLETSMAERKNWAEVQASRLIEAIKFAPGLRSLASNPLLLTIIASAHRRGRLPHHRIELYDECADMLIERWEKFRQSQSAYSDGMRISANEAMKIFSYLALWMQDEKRSSTVSGDELEVKLKSILTERGYPKQEAANIAHTFLLSERNRIGLLVDRGINVFSFLHLTFQQYFAARALISGGGSYIDKLRPHLHDPRWREVILLAVGQVGIVQLMEDLVTNMVRDIADSHSPLEYILHRDLLLAGRCLADNVGVAPHEQERIIRRLLNLWHTADFERLRQEVAEILAAMWGTPSEPTVLDAMTKDLESANTDVCDHATEVLGRMGKSSDQVLENLTSLLRRSHSPRVRAHAALALSRLNVAPEKVANNLRNALQSEHDQEARRRIAEALAYIGEANNQAMELLLESLQHPDGPVRGSAAAALASLDNPPVSSLRPLLKALNDTRLDVRTYAAEILGRLCQISHEAVNGLLRMLRDPQENARVSAAMALGQVGETSPEIVQALIECLADDSFTVRKNAATALGRLGQKSREVIAALEQATQDYRTGVGAVDALGQAGKTDRRYAGLTERQLQAADWQARIQAVDALVSQDKEGQSVDKVVETLKAVLKEEHRMGWDVIKGTAIALSEMVKRNPRALPVLLALLKDESWLVRTAVAEALGKAEKNTPEVVEALIDTMQNDSDDHARGNATTALGALNVADDPVINMLVKALGDDQGYVRVAAAEALAKLEVGSRKDVLDGLCRLLVDGYYSHYHAKYVREAAFDALKALAPYSSQMMDG